VLGVLGFQQQTYLLARIHLSHQACDYRLCDLEAVGLLV